MEWSLILGGGGLLAGLAGFVTGIYDSWTIIGTVACAGIFLYGIFGRSR